MGDTDSILTDVNRAPPSLYYHYRGKKDYAQSRETQENRYQRKYRDDVFDTGSFWADIFHHF